VRNAKRIPSRSHATSSTQNPLVGILRQYGLLESVVSGLYANDLLALALTSKALNEAITPRPCSLENLLGRLSCAGKGVQIRNACHKKSTFFLEYNCTEYVQCATSSKKRNLETRPCASCKVATCNECRTHCVYQSIYESPSDPEDSAELPNFSGFVLLEPLEQPILSPHHLPNDAATNPRWQDASAGDSGPYHDQGYLDVPLQLGVDAPPECIEDVLEYDLGEQSLMFLSEDSRYGSPSPVLSSLCRVTEARLLFLCECCFERTAAQGPKPDKRMIEAPPSLPLSIPPTTRCHCTLKKRFLERWLCLRCYLKEDAAITERTAAMPMKSTGLCPCGEEACYTLCLWCWGQVSEHERDDELSETATNEARSLH
jgi:hypothetical protein